MEVVVVSDGLCHVVQTAQEELEGVGESLHQLGAAVLGGAVREGGDRRGTHLQRGRVGDGPVSWGHHKARPADWPQVGSKSSCEELTE